MNIDRPRSGNGASILTALSPTAPARSSAAIRSRALAGLKLATCLAASVVALACSDSESTSSSAATVPPSLSITRITPVGAPSWEPGSSCVERGHDLDGSLAVSVSLSDAELRAPGACGARDACGHLVFSISSSDGFSRSSLSSSLSQTFSLADAATGVTYEFSVALVDDDGGALLANSAPVSASASLTLAAAGDCGGQPISDAGADVVAPDAASDASSDAASDASSDAASDASSDASGDAASGDAASDAGTDASTDASTSDAADAAG